MKKFVFDPAFRRTFLAFVERVCSEKANLQALNCLRDKYHLNENVLLFACWMGGQNYRCLNQHDFRFILKKIAPWHQKIVQGLQLLLQSVKEQGHRQRIKELRTILFEVETFASRLELLSIFQLTRHLEAQPQQKKNAMNRAMTNVFSYVHSQQISIHQNDLEKIYRFVSSSFS